eukprot:2381014-Amphidinium_carterae.1
MVREGGTALEWRMLGATVEAVIMQRRSDEATHRRQIQSAECTVHFTSPTRPSHRNSQHFEEYHTQEKRNPGNGKLWNTHLFNSCRFSYVVSYCFGVFFGREGIPGFALPGFILS